MKQLIFFLIAIFTFTQLSAQILQPAKIDVSVSSINVKAGDEIILTFKATIDENWYLYSNGFDEDCGPIPFSINLTKNNNFVLAGNLTAEKDKGKHDDTFDCDVRYMTSTGTFKQKIKVLSGPLQLSGTFEGQVCSEKDGKCIPVDGDIELPVIQVSGKASSEKPKENNQPKEEENKKEIKENPFASKENVLPAGDTSSQTQENIIKNNGAAIQGPTLDVNLSAQANPETSFVWFFLLAFVAGLAALLTPCVFPMIPMTVSFFTGQQNSKSKALLYGAFIVGIYTIIGALLAPLMGPETANHLSTEWLPNLILFAVFIVFGLSFLGLFEITLPSGLVNKVDRQADKGGWIGIFFMAFTLVLVSFSCTGPIVGSILVSSAGGEFIKPIVGMLGFSLAFAIPFTLFAFFPGWLSNLPKSGGWLNAVKVVLGFIEIALAFKFLSIADQAFHWGILDREINIAIWIVCAALIGLYLMKAFRMPGDTGKDVEDKRVSVPRVVLAIITFTFVIYLIPGMYGAPLKALAGYLPPLYTHDFNLIKSSQANNELCEPPKYADFLHLPHGLKGYFDYEQAMQCAREQNKPVFIDFTGHGCTNCREMEAVVWSDPTVLQKLQNDFIVVALYVDDKTELPASEWYTSTYDNKVKKTIGKQNADLQITRLQNNAQPFYVLVGTDEKVLVPPYGYNRDPAQFVKFLEEGLKKFRN